MYIKFELKKAKELSLMTLTLRFQKWHEELGKLSLEH